MEWLYLLVFTYLSTGLTNCLQITLHVQLVITVTEKREKNILGDI